MEMKHHKFDGLANMRPSDWDTFRKVYDLISEAEQILGNGAAYMNTDLYDLIVPVSNYMELVVALNGMIKVDDRGDILEDRIDWGLVHG